MYKKPDLDGFMGDLVVEKLKISRGDRQLYIFMGDTKAGAVRPLHLRPQIRKIVHIGPFDV